MKQTEFVIYKSSFYDAVVLTIGLYFLAYFPGLISNIIFLIQGIEAEKMACKSLPGVGTLMWMFLLNLICWIALCCGIGTIILVANT